MNEVLRSFGGWMLVAYAACATVACGGTSASDVQEGTSSTAAALEKPAGDPSSADDAELGKKRHFVGHIYAMTNGFDSNAIVHYGRRSDGKLVELSTTPTGGLGSGKFAIPDLSVFQPPDPLFSQGALRVSSDHRFVLAVNTRDHSISVFRIGDEGEPVLTDVQDSGGIWPNAVAVSDNLVYVENTGDQAHGVPATVNGFRLVHSGELVPIPDSARELASPATSFPVQVLFTKDATKLIVADVVANQLDVFPVHKNGRLGAPTFNPSAGPNPFGMGLTNDVLVVAEAAGMAPNATSASTYRLNGTHLTPISSKVPNNQTAGCWLSLTPDGRYAFVSNTGGGGTVSTYAISQRGELSLVLGEAAARPGPPDIGTSAPLDSFVSPDGRFFYQQFTALGAIGAYSIKSDGTLTAIPGGDGGGLPPLGSQGLDGF